ncbi:MAG: hypothetical protein IPK85_13735 [Gemmatimonadetes bacterium]|nr:hypothetical protein [Gemmatimonadota bacterium]
MAQPQSSPLIAGSVLPIKRAEELLATLPGVIAAKIIAGETGAVDEIHMLTTADVTPKQTVRNVESALIAHLGMRVDHRKISVATSVDGRKVSGAPVQPPVADAKVPVAVLTEPAVGERPPVGDAVAAVVEPGAGSSTLRRAYYFEDVEVSRSRAKGLTCRVTLARGGKSFTGEAEGTENERSRVELAARAALRALAEADQSLRLLDLAGVRVIEAFDREFVFVGVTVQHARASAMLTGSCELKDSAETASVLSVLDATNRWLGRR